MTCYTKFPLLDAKTMVYGLLGFCADGTGIPIRQQTLFVWIMAAMARNTATLIQGDRPGSSLGGPRILHKPLHGQTHLGLHLTGGHVPRHLRRRDCVHVRDDGMPLCHHVAVPAEPDRFGTELIRRALAWP